MADVSGAMDRNVVWRGQIDESLRAHFLDLAQKYGTPLYVYVEDILKRQVERVYDVFRNVKLLPTFACKANNNPALLLRLATHGFGVDIVTVGEYHAARLARVPAEKIVWNGNGKSMADMRYLSSRVGYVNVDSLEELGRWNDLGECPKLFLRINPDVEPQTHPHISTGVRFTKFGVHLSSVERAMVEAKGRVVGFHAHIGSQITAVEPFETTVEILTELSLRYGLSAVNIGGGWGIKYRDSELDLQAFKARVVPKLSMFDEVIVELGRFIVGPAGFLLVRVEYVKRTPYNTFVVADGGMNVLVRPSMYGAFHRIHVLEPTTETALVDVVGPLCETGDVLGKGVELPVPVEGSVIAIENAGAYGFAMASNYNSTPLPAEVLINLESGEERLIRRRQTYDQLFENVVFDS